MIPFHNGSNIDQQLGPTRWLSIKQRAGKVIKNHQSFGNRGTRVANSIHD